MRLLILAASIILAFYSYAQNGRWLDREISLQLDNDAFTLDIYLDRYYSQGTYLRYRVLDTTKLHKRVKGVSFNHRIFTNQSISLTDTSLYDRPFAGHLTFSGFLSFYHPKHVWTIDAEVGYMGKPSLAEPIQTYWHRWFGFGEPKGWPFQINDAPVVNAHFNWIQSLAGNENIELLANYNLALGTAFNYSSAHLIIRGGKLKPIKESVLTGGNLGSEKLKSATQVETNLFIKLGPEYVIYNSAIEGNLTGPESVLTRTAEKWVLDVAGGLLMSWSSFDLSIIYHNRSRETRNSERDAWMEILFSQRF